MYKRQLVELIGSARAKMILMAGAKIGAEEARAWGLIDGIAAPDALMAEARALAGDALAAKPGHGAVSYTHLDVYKRQVTDGDA